MRTRIPILLALFSAMAGAQTLDSTALSAMEAELSRFRAAHSIAYLGRIFFEIHSAEGVEYGFGVLRDIRPAGPGQSSEKEMEIHLNGRSIPPDGSLKVVANGVPGLPGTRGWTFPPKQDPGNGQLTQDTAAALGKKAMAYCGARRFEEAEGVVRTLQALDPDHPGIPLARAGCLEAQGLWRKANRQLELALRLEQPEKLEGLLDRIRANEIKVGYDSAYASQESRFLWLEWENGLGLTQGMLGTSLAAHANVGSFAASLAVGMGIDQFPPPAARFPAVGFRVYLPGRKYRLYGGYGMMNPFRWGPADRAYAFGPEAGLSHDIGGPRGFKLNYGLASWIVAKDRPKPGDSARDRSLMPQVSAAYAY